MTNNMREALDYLNQLLKTGWRLTEAIRLTAKLFSLSTQEVQEAFTLQP